ncbi:aminoacyl-tRNA hydrolase [Xylella fastidiosa]|uniref:Peptidyl-tRNA hydrolase n=2 Tax=Xylella fastidiosa TaxID=2371 RepID=PTH_XYLFM|nr:aminoacyl-tRNA hydrolase [Xylella fastidiosa]B0U5Y6.1 RecName: Full=Peptidyl-tRNA hydrolase; Short=PTH [Xylella fastidiosa M12]ERI60735.1 peptidyl-tRNA hydrolase [Xylella fastidiosa subsp. multiplex Griffin-1]ACA13058.1 Aminoacyl-tRNA hydrolase [Xylella fastidiosa M12]KAJ4853745.1 aminoacyl-tRNA hydrolase [Xylella fastidiosa subsp. multiplex]KFA40821.1 peptidyl-tRNA hydrolase [Xylella fastidiosa]MBE0267916.1 aminoacyl-tRNA hydrolase [Xylella fastidiosa subsp. multiplex]
MLGLRLIVGLGNPGSEYIKTRHNAGFRFVDGLVQREGQCWALESKLFAYVARVFIAGQWVWLLRPVTFMNLSGKSIFAGLNFWKIKPEQMLVAHDELDFPPGAVRLKFDGGHGGQNGLRDITKLLGHGRFHRLRVGIGHPGHKERVVSWVLGCPTCDENIAIDAALERASVVLPLAVAGDFDGAMKKLHTVV